MEEGNSHHINFSASSDGANPELVRAVRESIQNVLDNFKEAKGVVYLSIENLHVHMGALGGRRHPYPPPHLRRDRCRSRSISRGRSRSRSHSGHRKGRRFHGHHHGGHGHRGHPKHGRHHYWQFSSSPCSATEDTTAEETGVENSAVEEEPCCSKREKKHWKKGRRHSWSRFRGQHDHSKKHWKCCKENCVRKNKDEKKGETNGSQTEANINWEVVDLTAATEVAKEPNGEQPAQKELQEKFDNMNVKSP